MESLKKIAITSIDEVMTIEEPGRIFGKQSCTKRRGATAFTAKVRSKRWKGKSVIEERASPW